MPPPDLVIYLQAPTDAETAAHIGFLHTWRLSERARPATTPASITDDAVLARRYFDEAVALNPAEARYRGFQAGLVLAEASIHQDEKLRELVRLLLRQSRYRGERRFSLLSHVQAPL